MFDEVLKATLSPVRDAFDVVEGLSEGEFRRRAAIRLGADVVAGLTVAEIAELLSGDS